MEQHHPIMSKLWNLGGQTKRKKDIIDWGSKQLNLIADDVILRINLIDKLDKDYVMVKNEAVSAI